MKVSCAHLVRFLREKGRDVAYCSDEVSHELALEACRAHGRSAPLESGTAYVCTPESLVGAVRVPKGAMLVIAGEVPAGSQVFGQFASCRGTGFGELLNDVIELFERFANFEADLHRAVERESSAQELVDLATPLFGNEILLMDLQLRMIAHSYERIALYDVSGIEQLDEHIFAPAEVSDFFQNDLVFNSVEKAREPFYYEPSVFAVRVFCINILAQGEYAARLILCETSRGIEPCDENLFVRFGTFVQMLYDKTMTETSSLEDSLSSVVADLLDTISVLPARIDAAYERRGWSRGDMLVCACVVPAGYGSHERTVPYVSRKLARDFPEACTVERGGSIAMLVNLSKYSNNPDLFFSHMSIVQRESNLRIGQSPVFCSIEEVGGRFAQAKAALEIARAQGLQSWRNTFTGLRLSHLKRVLDDSIDARLLVAEEIERLTRYDEENGTDYVETLNAFFDERMNTVAAARRLFIHRATMVYRLKRIREIGGVDFDDSEQVLYLYLSLRVFMR